METVLCKLNNDLQTFNNGFKQCIMGRGFESHPSNMPVIYFFSQDSEYTVLTHIGVWVQKLINNNILYP